MQNGQVCLECGGDFQQDYHIRGQVACVKCKYQSACFPAVLDHVTICNGAETITPAPAPLGQDLHCICGFHGPDGNDLARHLASCERKSAYASAEQAQLNTVKCNVLDMLGLQRRDGEDDDDSNEGLLIPADQQQQLLSKSLDREDEEARGKDAEPSTTNGTLATNPVQADDFNTQLSLDDLAPPSVAPPQIEHDRTPQLSDEYQVSLINYY